MNSAKKVICALAQQKGRPTFHHPTRLMFSYHDVAQVVQSSESSVKASYYGAKDPKALELFWFEKACEAACEQGCL